MAHTYTQVYRALAVNVSTVSLAAAMAALPTDADYGALLGVTVTSDVTATALPNVVTRTIVTSDNALAVGPVFESGTSRRDAQQGQYTATFSAALGTHVTTTAVVMT